MSDLERRLGVELVRATTAIAAALETEQGREANLSFGSQRQLLREVLGRGDLEEILAAELLVLRYDRGVANDARERASLDQGISQLRVTLGLVGKVADPETYREVDEAHQFPRNRRGGLPIDEARQFFGSHRARLKNLRSGYGEPERKRVVAVREANMKAAERSYIELQRAALDRTPPSHTRENPGLER